MTKILELDYCCQCRFLRGRKRHYCQKFKYLGKPKPISDIYKIPPWCRLPDNNQPIENRPKIVCLCGSTRFTDRMLVKQWELTKQGCIVLSWCALPDWYWEGVGSTPDSLDKTHLGDLEGVKVLVDEVHKRKIDLADEVFIMNVNGYIGESTRSELDYAREHGKPVKFLNPE